MNAINAKVAALIGFAIRSGAIILGTDNIRRAKKTPGLIFVDDVSDNTLRRLQKIADETKAILIQTETPLGSVVHKPACRVIGITDPALIRGILDIMGGPST